MAAVAKKKISGKAPRRPIKRHGSYVPVAEQVRMCGEYIQGGPNNSIRKIAKRYKRDEHTVSNIVQSSQMEELAERMQQSLLRNTAEEIVMRLDYEVRTKKSKKGAEVALDLADRFGIIPPKVSKGNSVPFGFRPALDVEAKEVKEEDRVKNWVAALTEVAIERAEYFGMPMPELEEISNGKKKKQEVEIPLNGKHKEKTEK